jgi:hypothetical protein
VNSYSRDGRCFGFAWLTSVVPIDGVGCVVGLYQQADLYITAALGAAGTTQRVWQALAVEKPHAFEGCMRACCGVESRKLWIKAWCSAAVQNLLLLHSKLTMQYDRCNDISSSQASVTLFNLLLVTRIVTVPITLLTRVV